MAQFTIALDVEGKKINIDDAPDHGKYTCINCGSQMMAKRGSKREWHFSHYVNTEKCNHDGWLHKNIIDLFVNRLNADVPLIVEHPSASINLSNNVSFAREKEFEGWIPDILIKKSDEVIFVEVCVTNPCSKEKIASGYKIVEIFTSDSRVLDELRTGNIHANAEYYKLKFHNFARPIRKDEANAMRSKTPDILSEESDRKIGGSDSLTEKNTSQSEIAYCPQREPFNGKHANFFILHSDGTYEIKARCEACESDLLVLGVNTVADFAINIGKSYAWRKGLMKAEELTIFERHIDFPAVIKSFNVTEFKL